MVGPVEAEMSVPTALRKANAANVDDQEGGEAIKGEGEKPIYAIQPSILRHKDGVCRYFAVHVTHRLPLHGAVTTVKHGAKSLCLMFPIIIRARMP